MNTVFRLYRGSSRQQRWRAPDRYWPSLVTVATATACIWFLTGLHRMSADGGINFMTCFTSLQQNCVIDGDSVRYGGIRIRLADIDAPEVYSAQCASEAERGERATERLVQWMNEGPFEIVRRGDPDVDRYGRKLRALERNGRSAGDVLVAEGLARPWDGYRGGWCP